MKKQIFIFWITSLFILSGLNMSIAKADDLIASNLSNDTYGVTHYTQYNLVNMLRHQNEKKYKLPHFNPKKVKDLNSAQDILDANYKGEKLDIWDTWPLKDSKGYISNYHGYHIMFALTANTARYSLLQSKIYIFYQKVSNQYKGVNSWKSAGPVFTSLNQGVGNNKDPYLQAANSDWSGSAFLQDKNSIRLFYTGTSTGNQLEQRIMTAKLRLKLTKNGIKLDRSKTSDRKVIFQGDGKYYTTFNQWEKQKYKDGNCALRDPNYFEYKGHKYLTFEATTSTADGDDQMNQLSNVANIGGNSEFQKNRLSMFNINQIVPAYGTSMGIKEKAAMSNADTGLIELNNDFTIKKVLKPLMVYNTISSEMERPIMNYYKGNWYLFTSVHGIKLAQPNIPSDSSYLFGFVAKSPLGPFKPMNGNGLVLYDNRNLKSRTFNYSYEVIQSDKTPAVVTNYMGRVGDHSKGFSTVGNSFLLNIHGSESNIVQNKVLSQGQLVYGK